MDDNGNVIWGFFCCAEDFLYFEQHASANKEISFNAAELLSVNIDIDLTNRCMKNAKLDDEELYTSEALSLIFASPLI